MYARTARIFLVGLILALASVCGFAGARYQVVEKPTAFLITGTAASVDRLRETVELTDRGNTFVILTGRATIRLQNGKIGHTQDLKDNAYVQISGEQLSARSILATSVVVLDERAPAAVVAPQGYHPNDRIETTGAVTSVEASAGEIDIRTDNGNYALVVRPDTVIRRYIYVTDIGDVGENDDVSFTGRMGRDGKIVAERIQVSSAGSRSVRTTETKAYRPTYLSAVSRSQEDSIEGSITVPPSSFDRSLVLVTEYGERKVDVLKSAEVRIDKLPASVHDLTKGDNVRVFGTWDGDTMIAARIETCVPSATASYRVQELPYAEPAPSAPEPPEANPPAETAPVPAPPVEQPSASEPAPATDQPAPAEPAPGNPPASEPPKVNTLTGRIVAIDYTNLDLTVDAGLKDNKIDARDAAITRQGSTRRFSELKKGDKIEVKGDWNGDVLKATSVDVVE